MTLKWKDAQRIAEELYDNEPDLDPVTLRLRELRERVLALPDFDDDPEKSNGGDSPGLARRALKPNASGRDAAQFLSALQVGVDNLNGLLQDGVALFHRGSGRRFQMHGGIVANTFVRDQNRMIGAGRAVFIGPCSGTVVKRPVFGEARTEQIAGHLIGCKVRQPLLTSRLRQC